MMELQAPPENAEHIGEVMSNFDHAVNDEVEQKLKAGNFVADYPAWNFFGEVWWDGKRYRCAIKQYRSHVATVSRSTCQEIMDECSEKYGSD